MTDPTHSHTESQADPRASRRSFLKLAGIGGAVLIAGCDSDEPDPVEPGEFGNLSGRAVNAENGDPLSDVTIAVQGTTRTATTGDDGTYTFEDVPVGTYDIVATTANFQMAMEENVTIAMGSPATVDFSLTPGGDIVLDFEDDFGVLNYAYALEQLEAAFYAAVVADPDFATTFNADEQAILQDLAAHEAIHRDFFEAAITAAGGTISNRNLIPALTPDFEDVDFASRSSVLGTARTLEDLGVAAYNGAGELISSTGAGPTYLLIAGKIVSVEARHASVIAGLLTDNAIAPAGVIDTNGLDQALDPEEVLVAAAPFLVNGITAINV